MRPVWIRLALAAAVLVAVPAAAVFLATRPPEVVTASPTPTPTPRPTVAPTTAPPSPSPTLSPSPRPTVAPTATRTPEPTVSYIAGQRLIPLYFEIRQTFTALPPAPVIEPDLWEDEAENAIFRGLDAQGQPKFAVRHDFVIDKGTAAHEAGHAYQRVVERMNPSRDVMALYWSFRGFPGTWQQALADSTSQPSYSAKWISSPIESWAEAFRAAVTLEVKERTVDYGKTIDPMAARQFFQSLAK